jgi:hypothetical protein
VTRTVAARMACRVEGVASALPLSWADGSPRIVGEHGIRGLQMSKRHRGGIHRVAELSVVVLRSTQRMIWLSSATVTARSSRPSI